MGKFTFVREQNVLKVALPVNEKKAQWGFAVEEEEVAEREVEK